jgi:DNA-binding transcriptional regulator YiaG
MQLRLQQRELAELLDVTASAVNNWERGRNEPGPSQAPRVVARLAGR